ncbi:MAG: hypothetical protein OXJ64_00255, partial [Boseongicola sp.]|nr:hypothetical protein [Boseongicola sp.]
MAFISRIRSSALAVAVLAFAIAAEPLDAEITPATRASLDADILAYSRLGVARDGSEPVTEVATDFLFLLDTLQSIVDGPARLGAEIEICRTDLNREPDIAALADPDCLAALLRAERARWRVAAEIAAQAFLIAQGILAADLPLVAPEGFYEDAAAQAGAEAWWAENAPRVLAAYGRIG